MGRDQDDVVGLVGPTASLVVCHLQQNLNVNC